MTSPLKPWERPGINQQHTSLPPSNASSGLSDLSVVGEDGGGGGGGVHMPLTANAAPPPVPARTPTSIGSSYNGYNSQTYGGYSGYSGLGNYGMYGAGSMYGGGMYGSGMYGGYGGYGRYGMLNNGEYGMNSFARMAEENSRPAFQSIEGLVQAFGSVAMMLESTYSAVYNSFRAVIGVADHFSRMRTHFAQIFSAFALIKTLKWLYRKLLVFLRLREGGLQEDAWVSAADATAAIASGDPKAKANWPLMLFFAVIIGGPYLIWKFLSSLSGSNGTNWASGEDDHFVAQAQYDYIAQNEDEISFRSGQKINVAPKEQQPQMRGWLLASLDGKKMGIIPANYVKILGKRRGTKNRALLSDSAVNTNSISERRQDIPGSPSKQSSSQNLWSGQGKDILNGNINSVSNEQTWSDLQTTAEIPDSSVCSETDSALFSHSQENQTKQEIKST